MNLAERIKGADRAVLRKVVGSIDGHTIYPPEYFTDMGLDAEIVREFTETHVSEWDNPKETISVNGMPVASLEGVYGLSLLRAIANAFQVYSRKMGRGSQARDLAEQLLGNPLKNSHEKV